jgi:hypothetical protein
MHYRYILGVDPSGNFFEGKGTTGWSVLDTEKDTFISIGAISAKDFKTQEDYWGQHLLLIHNLEKTYKDKLCVSIEDYLLYASTSHSQINSKMETPQLLGVIKYYCYSNGVPLRIRPANAVKRRWNNHILEHRGYIHNEHGGYRPHCVNRNLCDHELDSMRHAVHCAEFENK